MIAPGIERDVRSALRQARGLAGAVSRALQGQALSSGERKVLEAARKTAWIQEEALVGLLTAEESRRQALLRDRLAGRAA